MRTRPPKKILIVNDDKCVADSLTLVLTDAGIMQTLERTSGNVKKNVQILRCPRPTFYRKLKKLGIKVERGVPPVAAKS